MSIMNELLFRSLPYDILVDIFSLIDQPSCLECMLVCRTWFYLVPQYAYRVWEHVALQGPVIDTRTSRCIGAHVRSYTLTYYPENIIPAILGTDHSGVRGLSLLGSSAETTMLPPLLAEIGWHLTDLILKGETCMLSLSQLLLMCPNLERCHYDLLSVPAVKMDDFPPHAHFPRLVELEILPPIQAVLLEELLVRCSNLQELAVHDVDHDNHVYAHYGAGGFQDMIHILCPSLQVLKCHSYSWEWLIPHPSAKYHPLPSSMAPTPSTLRELLFEGTGHFRHNDLIQLCRANEATVEALLISTSFEGAYIDWSCLATLHLPWLRSLHLRHIWTEANAVASLIHWHAPTLQDIVLDHVHLSTDVRSALKDCVHLRELQIRTDIENMDDLVETLRVHQMRLEALRIDALISQAVIEVIADMEQLEALELYDLSLIHENELRGLFGKFHDHRRHLRTLIAWTSQYMTDQPSVDSVQDLYQAMGNLREACDDLINTEVRKSNLNPLAEQQIRERIENFIRETTTTASSNILVDETGAQELLNLGCEPQDQGLLWRKTGLEKDARGLIEEIISMRRTLPTQMLPLIKDIVLERSYEVDHVDFEDANNNQGQDTGTGYTPPTEVEKMLNEHRDAMALLARLEEALPETTKDCEALLELLDNADKRRLQQ
ncbi:hypothetical protein BX666DRAFT_2029192 [Dichotomocladium elegans]|nr:hypothetical protein BX666DRAFT_2029192 [Dichotomocladium elegans]